MICAWMLQKYQVAMNISKVLLNYNTLFHSGTNNKQFLDWHQSLGQTWEKTKFKKNKTKCSQWFQPGGQHHKVDPLAHLLARSDMTKG